MGIETFVKEGWREMKGRDGGRGGGEVVIVPSPCDVRLANLCILYVYARMSAFTVHIIGDQV